MNAQYIANDIPHYIWAWLEIHLDQRFPTKLFSRDALQPAAQSQEIQENGIIPVIFKCVYIAIQMHSNGLVLAFESTSIHSHSFICILDNLFTSVFNLFAFECGRKKIFESSLSINKLTGLPAYQNKMVQILCKYILSC